MTQVMVPTAVRACVEGNSTQPGSAMLALSAALACAVGAAYRPYSPIHQFTPPSAFPHSGSDRNSKTTGGLLRLDFARLDPSSGTIALSAGSPHTTCGPAKKYKIHTHAPLLLPLPLGTVILPPVCLHVLLLITPSIPVVSSFRRLILRAEPSLLFFFPHNTPEGCETRAFPPHPPHAFASTRGRRHGRRPH